MSDTIRYPKDEPITINNEPFIDSNGNKLPTAVAVLTARRAADFLYFNGTIWIATPTQLPMTKVGDANSPGEWWFKFPAGLAEDEYIIEIIDTSGLSVNNIQIGKLIVDDELVKRSMIAASGAIGKAVYDKVTSIMTLYRYDDDSVVVHAFDMKNESGDPAGESAFFEKLP